MLIHAESVITCDGCVGFSLNVWCRNHGEVSPFSSLCLFCFEKTLSDLPSHIWSEFSIYGDLGNDRTKIDSELAFGFLKMGVTPIY